MAATAVTQEVPVAPNGIAGHDGPAGAPRREWNGQWFMPPAIALEHGMSAVRAFAFEGWRVTTGLANANVREAEVRKTEALRAGDSVPAVAGDVQSIPTAEVVKAARATRAKRKRKRDAIIYLRVSM